ncbi:MAG: hypothetical protein Q8K65_09325 [Alphaproteobacteria bacterium]|nr:hypothetical protein [Alphaproteobacteria bacterium]
MSNILSMLSAAAAGKNNAAVTKTAERRLIDRLAAEDPAKAKAVQERMDSMADTLRKMQQLRQDQAAARKEAARQKIARIKAQIQAMKMMAGADPKANARQLARLARELAGAVREFRGAGGAGGMDVTGGAVASSSAAPAAEGVAEGRTAAEAVSGAVQGDRSGRGGAPESSEEDRAFAEDVRRLQRQIKSMLEQEKRRLAEGGKVATDGTQGADAALRDVERHIYAIENPPPSINIQV